MHSKIFISDCIIDKKDRFGKRSETVLYPVWIVEADGKTLGYLTDQVLKDAIQRAKDNPEDKPKLNWFQKLFGG